MNDAAVVLSVLPDWVWGVPYVGASTPGAVSGDSWRDGANCQLFAYQVLALHGWTLDDLRSDDLWLDTTCTAAVSEPRPLDLVLFHEDEQPRGAHVGVVLSRDKVLHLCKEVGRPAVWEWEEFARRPRYGVVIGFKRPTCQLADCV